ncbi:pantothenate transporter [Ophiostoma piceae UAMH 11346]|uniref:Pantothenate transporter n=1 Tax=Ophiostoma piceae (strain UAMH 11346) TaxID=1262450 RepID=S3C9X5_OPHP1|nr:pantothenate transporter [Ophiostoma piceae UAMH 11346]
MAGSEHSKGAAAVVDTPSDGASSQGIDRAAFLASFTADEQTKVMRKIDYRLLVLAGLIYMVKQIDVNNASSVKVLSPGKPTNILVQLGMTSDEYNWVQSVYYIAYIVFELPSNLLLKRMGPRHFHTRIMFIWGAVLACHAAVTSKSGLLAARFFLGLAEAGLFPAMLTQFASWYRSDEMGKPVMWLFGIFSLANVIGSLLIYGMAFLDGKQGLSSWQWIFLLEGVATVAFSGVIYLLFPEYPKSKRTAEWLTPREQDFIEQRLADNAPLTADAKFSGKESRNILKDPRLWAFMITQVLMNTGNFGLTWFLPTIISNLGFAKSPRNILLLIPPAATTIIGMVIAFQVLKRAWVPRPVVALSVCLVEVGVFAIFIGTRARGAIYTACILGSTLSSVFAIPFWSWRSSSLKGSTGTAFAYGLQSGIGQLGGVIGPQIFRSQYVSNGYKVPYSVCTACIAGGFFGCLLCWYLTYRLENDVLRVQHEQIKAKLQNKLYTGDDVDYKNDRWINGDARL